MAFLHDSNLALLSSGYRGRSLFFFEDAVLPSPSVSSRLVKRHGQEPSVFRSDQIRTLAAKRASVVRAQDLDVPFLYYRSVVEGEERCSTACGAFFHSEKEMRKNRENFILVNIMMPVFAERIVHPMTLAENVVLLSISAE